LGGMLATVPIAAILLVALSGRRPPARTIGLAAVGAALVVVGVTAVDLLRPAADRTHLGTFASDLIHGRSAALTSVRRKLSTNIRVAGASAWRWVVLAVGALAAAMWRRVNPAAEVR